MPIGLIQPDGWATAKGYANGVLTPTALLLWVGRSAGTPIRYSKATISSARWNRPCATSRGASQAPAARSRDITRLTWYVTTRRTTSRARREVGEVYRKVFGRHFPAMTMVVVAGLVEDEALIEIEATAVLPRLAD